MKIFLNLLAGTTGGQVTRAKALLDRIKDNNSGIKLVVVKDHNLLKEYQTSAQIEIINVHLGNGRFKIFNRIWWETFSMPSLVRESIADIFITFSHFLPYRKFDIPTFVGVSNLAPFSAIALNEESAFTRSKFKLLRKTILSSAKRATAVMALSYTAEKVLTKHGVPARKIVVIPIGVDDFWCAPSEKAMILKVIGISTPFYLYVSHFYRYKNHLRLIDAYAKLPSSIQMQKKLVLVGKFENLGYIDEIKQLIVSKNVEDKVILISGQDMVTLRALYQSTDLFIFPSLVENCPNILLEAMAAGAPVATINIAPMTEYCEEAAVYFDGMSASDIARAIRELSINPSKTDLMRVLSKRRANNYSWDMFVNMIIIEARKIISLSNNIYI
jgi:glycosyltransferase involved in cell wall biosynthesis